MNVLLSKNVPLRFFTNVMPFSTEHRNIAHLAEMSRRKL